MRSERKSGARSPQVGESTLSVRRPPKQDVIIPIINSCRGHEAWGWRRADAHRASTLAGSRTQALPLVANNSGVPEAKPGPARPAAVRRGFNHSPAGYESRLQGVRKGGAAPAERLQHPATSCLLCPSSALGDPSARGSPNLDALTSSSAAAPTPPAPLPLRLPDSRDPLLRYTGNFVSAPCPTQGLYLLVGCGELLPDHGTDGAKAHQSPLRPGARTAAAAPGPAGSARCYAFSGAVPRPGGEALGACVLLPPQLGPRKGCWEM